MIYTNTYELKSSNRIISKKDMETIKNQGRLICSEEQVIFRRTLDCIA